MAKYRSKYSPFKCDKVASTVSASITYRVERGAGSDGADIETQVAFDCDKINQCDVQEKEGAAIKHNWEKCLHPLKPKEK